MYTLTLAARQDVGGCVRVLVSTAGDATGHLDAALQMTDSSSASRRSSQTNLAHVAHNLNAAIIDRHYDAGIVTDVSECVHEDSSRRNRNDVCQRDIETKPT